MVEDAERERTAGPASAGGEEVDADGAPAAGANGDTRAGAAGPDPATFAEAEEAGAEGEEAVEADADELAARLEQELAELERLRDRHLRLAAEFENFRKRTRREQAELRERAQAELAARILPTLDDLARVADTPTETATVEALDEGVELILRNLRKQLEEAGLSRIEAEEKPFDPELHEAVMTSPVEDPGLDETVARVFLEGYRFGDRLVRPAQVEVRKHDPEAGSGGGDGAG